MTPTYISYGGGVQSTALVVLAATGRIHADAALFANVGDDSEHPKTLDYVRDIAVPWAAELGLPVHELHRQRRDGSTETLVEHLHRGQRSIPIPMRMPDTGAPGTRNCTEKFKLAVVRKWIKANTTTRPADLYIGISTDEIERAGNGKDDAICHRRYPLLDLGLSRTDCASIIRDAGLPVPPKSACYFCPFHRPKTWAEMRRDEPDLFDKSQQIEDMLIARRIDLGKDPLYLTRFGKRLSDAIPEAQPALFDVHTDYGGDIGETGCDEGACFV